ncbi:MAG TPA: alkaline phosphatase family protein, partial [Ktedonobacteraceae bacterium]|nr:alkaline phosphatase family protein [Ktedonobacteraceae bacterium]
MNWRQWLMQRQSRRRALQAFGTVAGLGLALEASSLAGGKSLLSALAAPSDSPSSPAGSANPIQHVLIACQENHSFDHYFGYYPKAGKFGV